MGDKTGIKWTTSTFNPWAGCQKVSPGCDHCYAERDTTRLRFVKWGPRAERRRTSAANWRRPLKWNRDGGRRVFCGSWCDVFDNQVPPEWRADLWELIRSTPRNSWQLLSKRPENLPDMLPDDWGDGWPHVWLGTTVEDRPRKRRIDVLREIPAAVRFLSCEPLLEDLGELDLSGIDWVIVGGESGPNHRRMDPQWARDIREQCEAAGVPFFFKQAGGFRGGSHLLDGELIQQFPDETDRKSVGFLTTARFEADSA